MAARKLVTYVHVDGVAYGPDDDLPGEVAAKITNPKAWGEVEPDVKAPPAKAAPVARGAKE